MTPTFSVLTASLEARSHLLAQAMASVQAQTYRPLPDHLVLVNDDLTAQEKYNALAEAAETEWVCILDDDNLWLPHHLEAIAPATEGADVVYSFEANGILPRTDCAGWDAERIADEVIAAPFIDQNVAVRRSVFLAVGGFDPADTGPPRCMDQGLWLRAAQAGARFANIPRETWRYRVGPWNRPDSPDHWTADWGGVLGPTMRRRAQAGTL